MCVLNSNVFVVIEPRVYVFEDPLSFIFLAGTRIQPLRIAIRNAKNNE